MLNICDSVFKYDFKNSTDHGVFLDIWKMSQFIPIHKKNNKNSLNNIKQQQFPYKGKYRCF